MLLSEIADTDDATKLDALADAIAAKEKELSLDRDMARVLAPFVAKTMIEGAR